MKREDIEKIIEDNLVLSNIGGHFFEGTAKHNRREQGLPELSDLIPFEQEGRIKRVIGRDGIGKSYIRAFLRL